MNFIPENKNILTKAQAREMNPLVLAYIGDAVHSLYSREKFATTTTLKTHKLHEKVSEEVNAKAQAKLINELKESLNEEENEIFHRARNSHVNNVAKHASVLEYLEATGFEAVIGYLYLTGQQERLKLFLKNEE